MRKQWRKLFAALAFATLGPLGCVVGDTSSEDEMSVLEEAYSTAATCLDECDYYIQLCLSWPERCPECDQSNWSVQMCIANHQKCRLACPPQPECGCYSGSWCCRDSSGRWECGAQGTCSGGDDGGGGGGGGGGGETGACGNDWDCSPIEECNDSGSCVPLGCG